MVRHAESDSYHVLARCRFGLQLKIPSSPGDRIGYGHPSDGSLQGDRSGYDLGHFGFRKDLGGGQSVGDQTVVGGCARDLGQDGRRHGQDSEGQDDLEKTHAESRRSSRGYSGPMVSRHTKTLLESQGLEQLQGSRKHRRATAARSSIALLRP